MTSWISRVVDFFKRNKYHFIGWAVFIAYEVGIVGTIIGSYGEVSKHLANYTISIFLFYTHALIILPFALKKKKCTIVILFLFIVIECVVYTLVIYLLLSVFVNYKPTNFKPFIQLIWKCIYFIGLSSTYYLFKRLKFENIRNMELEKARFNSIIEIKDIEYELIKSNYAYLRAQINPHFLFNLLNFLYDKIKKKSVKAANAMHILSEMMQYSLTTTGKKKFVVVAEELEQIKKLIHLNQLRFEDQLQIEFNYSKEVLDFKIIPLVLLTLVENMFKHGDLTHLDKKASIHLYIENEEFHIVTSNTIAVKASYIKRCRAGVNNVKKRLALAYGAMSFECSANNGKFFSAHVSIPVSCLNGLANFVTEHENDQNFTNNTSFNNHKVDWKSGLLVFFRKNKYHFIGWVVFMTYEVCLLGFVMGKFGTIGGYLLYYTLNALLFYFHALFALPFALNKTKYQIAILCFIIIFEHLIYLTNYVTIIPLLGGFFKLDLDSLGKFDFKLWLQITWRFLYFVGFSWTYYLFRRNNFKNKLNLELEQTRFREIIKKKDIEQELIRSNYAYLRAQIDPHFLFNVLNFLYDEAKKSSQEVSDAIMVLSEMMQYSLGGLQQEFVVVSEEIEQVEHLIYLHQLQCENTLQIEFSYSDEVVHLEIIPLVLLTLVENMFKHGDFTSPNKKASINVYIDNNVFHIVTINHLRIGGTELGHGTGLDNIKRRLAFAYSGTENVEFFTNEHHQFVARVEIPVSSIVNPRKADAKV